jgi:hypothetical protein
MNKQSQSKQEQSVSLKVKKNYVNVTSANRDSYHY